MMETISQPQRPHSAPGIKSLTYEEKEKRAHLLGKKKPTKLERRAVLDSLDQDMSGILLKVSEANVIKNVAEASPKDLPPPNQPADHEHKLLATKQSARVNEPAQGIAEEKFKFAVILAERIADILDAHQTHAVKTNPQQLLRSKELIGRFKKFFVEAIDSSQTFPVVMTRHEAYSFLGHVNFHHNYLRHLKCRTYHDVSGTTLATGTVPSTPGIGGWIYLVNSDQWIRKSDGYGNDVVEEMLRRGTEGAAILERSSSQWVTKLTTQAVEWIERVHAEEQQWAIREVIRKFKESDEQWCLGRTQSRQMTAGTQFFAENATRPFSMPSTTPLQYGYTDTSGFRYNSYPGMLSISPGPQQRGLGHSYSSLSAYQQHLVVARHASPGFTPSYPPNNPFARQIGEVRSVSSDTYGIDQNELEQMVYYGTGSYSQRQEDQQPMSDKAFTTIYNGFGNMKGGAAPEPHGQRSESMAKHGFRPELSASKQESNKEKKKKPSKKASKSWAKQSTKKANVGGTTTSQDLALEENAGLSSQWPGLPG